jgi:hypothetical protein
VREGKVAVASVEIKRKDLEGEVHSGIFSPMNMFKTKKGAGRDQKYGGLSVQYDPPPPPQKKWKNFEGDMIHKT